MNNKKNKTKQEGFLKILITEKGLKLSIKQLKEFHKIEKIKFHRTQKNLNDYAHTLKKCPNNF